MKTFTVLVVTHGGDVMAADFTHLWKVGQKIRYASKDEELEWATGQEKVTWYKGTVKEVYPDHLIVDVPDICDHLWFQDNFNLNALYPEDNFF